MDGQFWRFYRDKRGASPGTHQHITVANGQRQRRFWSGLANRYCPGILRRAHADLDTHSNGQRHANSHRNIYPNHNPYSYSQSDRYTNGHSYANGYCDSHSYCDSHPHSNCKPYCYSHD